MGWQVDLSREDDFIGKSALEKVKVDGVTHKLAGLKMGGKPIEWYNSDFYHVFAEDKKVGRFGFFQWVVFLRLVLLVRTGVLHCHMSQLLRVLSVVVVLCSTVTDNYSVL